VEGVDITATTGEIELPLIDRGGGQYPVRLEIKKLEIGVHSVAVTATKEGLRIWHQPRKHWRWRRAGVSLTSWIYRFY